MKTIVIGSGLSGLMAAYISRKRGDDVTLLTAGAGTLAQNSGGIDILGFGEGKVPITSPKEGIKDLPDTHPYKKIGVEHLEDAVGKFLKLMSEYGLPYRGSLDKIISVPTAIGTLKPTSFVPASLDGSPLFDVKKIIVVGIERLKDFYGDILADNLSKILTDKEFQNIVVDLEIPGYRDVTTIDVARFLEDKDRINKLMYALEPHTNEGVAFIVPQILGVKGDELHKNLTEKLQVPIVETTCLPPSVNGMRIERILRRALFDIGVNFSENSRVLRGIAQNGKISAAVVRAMARDVKYEADKFILATGGFYGGGLTLENFNSPHETVFRLPVWIPENKEGWANSKLFSDRPQGFAMAGILTDNSLRPLDKKGKVLYNNLFVVGRNLGGYDFCFEHSGNGVALASAYHAAMQPIEEGE